MINEVDDFQKYDLFYFFLEMSSVVDVLCAEIQKSIERLNKSRLILIKCTQMLKEYNDKKFSV